MHLRMDGWMDGFDWIRLDSIGFIGFDWIRLDAKKTRQDVTQAGRTFGALYTLEFFVNKY
jgi:hypothetical protein